MALTKEQKDELAKKMHDAYISEFKEAYPDNIPEDLSDDDGINEEFGIWLDAKHPEFPEWTYEELMDDNGGEGEADDSYGYIQLKAMPKLDELKALYGDVADNSEESEDKPHEEDILPDGEESELEKKMTPEEFKIASNITGRSTGDFEPETPEDVQFMLEANKNGLKVSDERLKNVQNNSINSIANTLKNYRW